jgi:signal transduction histidine kinase
MLYEFITLNRDEIVRRCRAKVATRSVPPPTAAEIDHGVPLFLNQLVDALRLGVSESSQISATAVLHGHDLLLQGFTVSQVVHDYGDVCQSITELATETNAPISAYDFRLLNGCLDNAIAEAVTQFARERNQSTLGGGSARENERLGFFSHELRNLLQTALVAFDVVKSGNVGVGGSTGAVLHRSLLGARDLVIRSLAEVRLTQGVQNREPFLISGFIDELTAAAQLAANAEGLTLAVMPIDAGLSVEADRQCLAAVAMNILQNAFKFTRSRSTVTLRVDATVERVLIEVQDECGGLPTGDVDDLFRPFEQRNLNRTGAGLGLAFSRWATEANGGRLYARSLPHVGCVFTIDLPRCPVANGNPIADAVIVAQHTVER